MKLPLALVLTVLSTLSSVHAATFTVTRTDDPAPNGCQPGDCSLREAVIAANAAASADVILMPPTDYGLTLVGAGGAESGDLDITGALTVRGSGMVGSTIQASNLMRIFDVSAGDTLHLEYLKFLNGEPGAGEGGNGGCLKASDATVTAWLTGFDGCVGSNGGAISATNSNLSLTDSSISNSSASFGGAVHVSATGGAPLHTFVAHNVILAYNDAGADGGALYLAGAALRSELVGALIIGNTSPSGSGGGIRIISGGSGGAQLDLDRVTLANNHANRGGGLNVADAVVEARRTRVIDNIADTNGGGVYMGSPNGSLLFEQSTAYGNAASAAGGAIRLNFGQLVVRNSTIGDNTASVGSALYAESGASVRFEHATLADGESDIVRINSTGTTVSFSNSIISADFNAACSIFSGNAEFISLGGNLEGADSCGLNQSSDLVHLMPFQIGLDTLDFHGGATENYSLDPGSEAIDHALSGTCLHTDQRLAVREPASCDAGSHEAEGIANDHIFSDGFDT